MTDREIHDLIASCRTKGNASWDVLVSQFGRQLVALSDRLTEEELYALMEIAIACYQKGYDEFTAGAEAKYLINDIRRRARQMNS